MSKKSPAKAQGCVVPAPTGEPVTTLPFPEYHRSVSKQQRFISLSGWRLVAKRLYVETFFRALMDRGAVLSFFTLLTSIPTLMAFYSITTLVLDQNRSKITEITDEFITENIPENFTNEAHRVIDTIIGSTQQSVITLLISVLIALFSSSAYVRAFSRSANWMYGRQEGRGLLVTWLTMWGLTLLLVLGLTLIATGFFLRADLLAPILNGISKPLGWEGFTGFFLEKFLPVWSYLRWPVIFGLSMVMIAVLYHGAPNVRYGRVRWLTTGSVFALVSMTLVACGVRIYLNNFLHIGMYGALGGLIAGFIGLVLMNSLLLFGVKIDAEVTRVRELQAGLHSESEIQVPPRSSVAAEVNNEFEMQMTDQAIAYREKFAERDEV